MAGAVLLAFVVGVGVGIFLGRRSTVARPEVAPAAPPPVGAAVPPVVTKRGRKAGLTPEALQPSDDILERLRRVEAGELDPTELHGPPPEKPAAPAPPLVPDPDLAERERRILERLQREAQSDFSKQRESGEER